MNEPAAAPLTRGELYRAVSIIAGLLAVALFHLDFPNIHPFVKLVLALAAVGGGVYRLGWAPSLLFLAYALAEVNRRESRAGVSLIDLWTAAGLLGYAFVHARLMAGADLEPLSPPQRRPFAWLLRPLKLQSDAAHDVRPAELGELVRMAALLPLWVLVGNIAYRLVPEERMASLGFPFPPPVIHLMAVGLVVGAVAIASRVALASIAREKMDPRRAELELNDVVWTELRPELTRTAAYFGSEAERESRQ
ncbi:MAG TPA: hypothetical protein VNC50_02075 [Planctomycetia bacterium]|nr:hypothetical protein [Planctomycetia bacterium]